VSHLEKFAFFTNDQDMSNHLWTKFRLIEAASNKYNHLVAIKG